jgi:hypothetical protein
MLRGMLRLGLGPAWMEAGSRDAKEWTALNDYLVELSERSMDELGDNAVRRP